VPYRSIRPVRVHPGSPYTSNVFGDPDWRPVRTNNNLMVNGPPDGWVRDQMWPVGWDPDLVADDGTPPAWWVGRSKDAIPFGPIGPHGPWSELEWASMPVITHATALVVDPLTRYRVADVRNPRRHVDTPVWLDDPQLLRADDRINPNPLLPALQRVPAPTFWRDWIVAALWWGYGVVYCHLDENDQPRPGTLRHLDPSHLQVDDTGRVWLGDLEVDEYGRITFDRGVRARLIVLRNPLTPDGVFMAYPNLFKLGQKLSAYERGTFNSGIPSGYLKVNNPQPITQEQADDLKARWMNAHGGDRRSIAVLNAYTDFQAVQLSPVASGLADVKRLNLADVAYAFNLPPALLGTSVMAGGGTGTYANLEQWWEQRRDVTLPPWLGAVEGTLSALLPRGLNVVTDLDEYTYGSFSERIDQYARGVEAGIDPSWLADRLKVYPATTTPREV
jgi:phage portal protein BeeE